MVVSNIFYFHPYLEKIPILTNIFQRGWNHQPEITPKNGGQESIALLYWLLAREARCDSCDFSNPDLQKTMAAEGHQLSKEV